MNTSVKYNEPLISVIIPCYNHAEYLATAISSVYNQEGYSNYEIIVVDDGSSDNTKAVTESFPGVLYTHQQNAGLSAARNTGIKYSNGAYLIFLDADDWLYADAMAINSKYLMGKDEIAFVSGAYEYLYEDEGRSEILGMEVLDNHYCAMLESNYIGMHATVLYQRWVFNFFKYDTTLKACEDYDMYLRITRKFPVIHHTHLIAVYRIHNKNMSGNILLMLDSALLVLRKQEAFLKNDTEKECFKKGLAAWQSYYEEELYERLIFQLDTGSLNKEYVSALRVYNKGLYLKFLKSQRFFFIKQYANKFLPGFVYKSLFKSNR